MTLRAGLIFLFFTMGIGAMTAQVCCSNLRELGNKAFRVGNYPEAIRLYKKAQACGDANKCPDLSALINEAQEKAKPKTSSNPTTNKPRPRRDEEEDTPSVTNSFDDPFENQMVFVQGGTFQMGDNFGDGFDDEKPVHTVTVSDFHIGKYEVTQAQWRAVMGNNPSHFKGDNLPVESVSWNDIQDFLRKLNAKTGKNYRLPTEAEWEYAAKGGNQSNGFKYSGSNSLANVAWFTENSNSKTQPVGQKKANELGIYDMSGNVWEWGQDVWHENYNGAPTNGSAWTSGGDQSIRVLRGGSWNYIPINCRVSYRGRSFPTYRNDNYGFRIIRR